MQFNKFEFFYLKEIVIIGPRRQLLSRTNFFILALALRVSTDMQNANSCNKSQIYVFLLRVWVISVNTKAINYSKEKFHYIRLQESFAYLFHTLVPQNHKDTYRDFYPSRYHHADKVGCSVLQTQIILLSQLLIKKNKSFYVYEAHK